MPEEVAIALNEIAALLRRRVEQTDEAARRAEAHFATIKAHDPAERPDFAKRMEENATRAARAYEGIDKSRAEEKMFRDRLLDTLDRQNALLAQLIEHLARK